MNNGIEVTAFRSTLGSSTVDLSLKWLNRHLTFRVKSDTFGLTNDIKVKDVDELINELDNLKNAAEALKEMYSDDDLILRSKKDLIEDHSTKRLKLVNSEASSVNFRKRMDNALLTKFAHATGRRIGYVETVLHKLSNNSSMYIIVKKTDHSFKTSVELLERILNPVGINVELVYPKKN